MAFTEEQIAANREYFARKLAATRQEMDLVRRLRGEADAADYLLLDVRGDEAFAQSHIEGAISVPVASLDQRMAELPKDRELVVYCWKKTCMEGAKAAVRLAEAGFYVRELNTGWREWCAADQPTHEGTPEGIRCSCSFP